MRDMSVTNSEEAKKSGWQVIAGDLGEWELVCKAYNEELGIMKSTKRMAIGNDKYDVIGYLYQVTTEGPKGYAEALAFVPDPF